MIRAFCYSDDRRYEVDFDATAWFEQATDLEITDLAACDFGGDYPADAVAWWMADHDPRIAEMLQYVNNPNLSQGFECHVDEEPATKWIRTHRPYLIENGEVRTRPWGPKDWSPQQSQSRKPNKKEKRK